MRTSVSVRDLSGCITNIRNLDLSKGTGFLDRFFMVLFSHVRQLFKQTTTICLTSVHFVKFGSNYELTVVYEIWGSHFAELKIASICDVTRGRQ